MKCWRIFAAAAVVGMLLPGSVALADDDDDDDDSGGAGCSKDTNKALRKDLTTCINMLDATSSNVGNGFPWENDAGSFATYRNQFLYYSENISETSKIACTLESVAARDTSFTGNSTNIWGSFANGGKSSLVGGGAVGPLNRDFALNSNGFEYCRLEGDDTNPINFGNTTGPRGSSRSTCNSCLSADKWCSFGDITGGLDTQFGAGVLWDFQHSINPGGSGAGVWDTSNSTGNSCDNSGKSPERAYGSAAFANPQHMTTALAIDGFDFVWVFEGKAPPPAATVEQQIKEIIRLLLTPEGLRCSGLDLNAGNGKIEDDPISFPNGAQWDPIQPQVATGGKTTGDEAVDDLRSAGFRP
jgi:hypothetical protein